jgi:signal transduction histidine kinase
VVVDAADPTRLAELELLFEVTAAISRAEDVADVHHLALAAVARASDADRVAILIADTRGSMRFATSRGLSETYQRAVEGHSPWAADAEDPQPVVVDDAETDPAWAKYRDVFRAEGIRALAFVPLVHQRQLLGKFMLYRDAARAFAPRDIQLAATIAVHVAHAVARHRSQEALARALRDERAATRACEEILSVVSHDLRNPLGAVLMGASSLLHVPTEPADPRLERVRTTAERIVRQATRMARQIDDLVDFAGIQAGRLSLDRRVHAPADLVAAAAEIFGSLADERGVKLEAARPELPPIVCDADRGVQVLANLIANALKVTPRGGAISIGAEARGEAPLFYVRDTGPGIDASELPHLFERYWRSASSSYKGTGLGLSIASGIVAAHGGKIWVDSAPGTGSTFWFSLTSP